MSKHERADMYMADRARGMSYREIGRKYGVSAQAVQSCCAGQGEMPRNVIDPRSCIWPNLREWLNSDWERKYRFFQAMEGCAIRNVLKGIQQPKKDVIDKMIAITGMSYEVLFAEEQYE